MRTPLLRSAAFVLAYFLILLAAAVPKGMVPRRFGDLTWGVLSSLAVYGLTRWLLTRERRIPHELGLDVTRSSILRLLAGLVLGVALYGATVVVIALVVSPVRLAPNAPPPLSTWLLMVSGFLALACMEELGFRAYPLRTLLPVLGHWPAQLLVASVFALSHMLTGWPWETALLGVFPSALLFGALAVRSGGLALPIGLHAALNIAYWAVGAKETPGVWTIVIAPAQASQVATAAPWIGAGVTLLAAVLAAYSPHGTDTSSRS